MEAFTPKKVDESWKASEAPAVPEADFLSFVSTLAMQTLAALGELAFEEGAQPRVDLTQAQYLIDTIQMLSDKTRNNISKEETDALNALLYELRVKFVAKKQSEVSS